MNFLLPSSSKVCEAPINGLAFEEYENIADVIRKQIQSTPKVGIICGTGLGTLGEKIEKATVVHYGKIPHFPKPTVEGHHGKLISGLLDGVPVLCFQGRFHFYEGHPIWKCALPVRVMKLLGIENLIVSNAAGGLHPEYQVGDIMVINDHVNFHGFGGQTPLTGKNEDRFGPRFFSMTCAYDKPLRAVAAKLGELQKIRGTMREGVYVMLSGPAFETPAELRLLRKLGVDAVGMSTIPEVITARHCNMRVFAFSLITNICITDQDNNEEAHVDPLAVGEESAPDVLALVSTVVKEMAKRPTPVVLDNNLGYL